MSLPQCGRALLLQILLPGPVVTTTRLAPPSTAAPLRLVRLNADTTSYDAVLQEMLRHLN